MTDNTEKQESNQDKNDGNVSYDDFMSDMVDNIPEVQEHVIAAEQAKSDALNNTTDTTHEKFDPNIHVVGKDGKPSVTKTGKFRKKKNINNPHEKKPADIEKEANHLESEASAELVQTLKRSVYDGLFDYKYNDARHKVHVTATTQYFVEAGGVKLTPLQNLMILEGFLALEVMRTPKATKKLTGLKAWFASKYVKFKGRKNNDTQSDNRANNVGKNDTSEKDSASQV